MTENIQKNPWQVSLLYFLPSESEYEEDVVWREEIETCIVYIPSHITEQMAALEYIQKSSEGPASLLSATPLAVESNQ